MRRVCFPRDSAREVDAVYPAPARSRGAGLAALLRFGPGLRVPVDPKGGEVRKPTTVAAVDVEALESEALSAIAAAQTLDELDEARVRYLGRKSPLKLALREVRDRESGMVLNALRERV